MSVELVKLFSSVDRVLKTNLRGITNAESLTQIDNCNTLNWLVGHLVICRNGVHSLIGIPAIGNEKIKAMYERGSKRMTDTSGAEDLETLVKMFDESQVKVMEGVAKVTGEQVKEKLAFLGFHEAYHVGQIGTMRKLLGKEGAIK
jgi:DNA polymerase/3'-5' exonuclease PolX